MIHHRLKKHTYKIALGVPMVILLASSLSISRDTQEVCLVPDDSRYVEVGEKVTLHITAQADTPINVIGATLLIPTEYVGLKEISRADSIIDLWSEEPVMKDDGTLHFSGGMIDTGGFIGNGRVLTLVVVPKKEGVVDIGFSETKMLAHDGTGSEIDCKSGPITLRVRPTSFPNPDVNNDRKVNVLDFGIVSARMFVAYERLYDLNLDGKINLADLGIVIANMYASGRLGSLALYWR